MNEVDAGDICALFGIECNSGDTFVTGTDLNLTMVGGNQPDRPNDATTD